MKFAIQDGLIVSGSEIEFFTRARDWGFDAVEVMGEGLVDRLDRVRAAAALLPVCAICPGLNGIRGSLLDSDSDVRARAHSDILSLLQCAAELGGAGLNIVPEFAAVKFMKLFPDYDNFEKRKDEYIERLDPIAGEAERLGVHILLEPLNRYEADFLLTVEQAASICRAVRGGAVGVLADMFHINIEEPDPAGAFRKNSDCIFHVHAADSNRLLPGLGHTDFKPVFNVLRQAGYKGYVSMECAVTDDPDEQIPASLRFLKSFLSG